MVRERLFFFIALSVFLPTTHAIVTLKVSGLKAEISNDLVKFNFKKDATISTAVVADTNIISGADRSFYLDWTGTGGEIRFHPHSIHIVEQTDTRAHFYWTQESNVTKDFLNIELHYILEDDLAGIYSYAKYTNDKSANVSFAESRMVYRFSPSLFTQGANQVRMGTLPSKSEINKSKKVQDATYEFSNGTYYTKYDFAVYIRETQYQGLFGNGYGAFVISPSREYHGGGPLKQDLTVHEYSLITNYFLSAHFGCPAFNAPPDWVHIYGPFLIYLTTGDDDEVLSAAKEQATIEKTKWPYSFVTETEYPLIRGSITGSVSGQKKATIALYDSINEQFDLQQLGYLYTTNTNSDGYYNLSNIRPGTYKIVAYPIAGQGSENLEIQQVNIKAGDVAQVDFTLPEPENILWSLGEANRRSNEFNYADQPRNYKWEFMPPTTNTFVIGESDPKTDWYYAQSQPGSWYIKYQDNPDGNSRTLRLAIAAACKTELTVFINSYNLADLELENDAAIYRSAMQSGKFRSNILQIDAGKVISGENVIELKVVLGSVMYDSISLQISK